MPTYMCIRRNRFQDLVLCTSRNYLAASDRFIASSLKLEVHRTIRKRIWVGEVTKKEASRVLWNLPSLSGVYENRLISTEIHQFQLLLTLDDMNSLQKLGGFTVEFSVLTPRVGVEEAEERASSVERLQVWIWPHSSKVSHQLSDNM